MYKAIVDQRSFEILQGEDSFVVNGEQVEIDVAALGERSFSILYKNKSYRAEVVKAETSTKTFLIKVNGRVYPVQVKDKFDLLLEKMGMQNMNSGKVNSIKAPMPGLIIDLKVKEGDVVKQNEPLLILEAMKMENIIKSPGDGVVKSVRVQKGNSVEKNQVLIEF